MVIGKAPGKLVSLVVENYSMRKKTGKQINYLKLIIS